MAFKRPEELLPIAPTWEQVAEANVATSMLRQRIEEAQAKKITLLRGETREEWSFDRMERDRFKCDVLKFPVELVNIPYDSIRLVQRELEDAGWTVIRSTWDSSTWSCEAWFNRRPLHTVDS